MTFRFIAVSIILDECILISMSPTQISQKKNKHNDDSRRDKSLDRSKDITRKLRVTRSTNCSLIKDNIMANELDYCIDCSKRKVGFFEKKKIKNLKFK